MIWAVFTGDIVNSTDMSKDQLDTVIEGLETLATDVSDWPNNRGERTLTGFARRGGDGWQIACQQLKNPLRLALCAQCQVISRVEHAATRIAVAIGEGTVTHDLNSAHGPAFTASGQLLEQIGARRLLAHAQGGAIDAAFCLADQIAQGWTQAQARALYPKLQPGAVANRVIAGRLGISRQAVDQALAGAGYPALADALDVLDRRAGGENT